MNFLPKKQTILIVLSTLLPFSGLAMDADLIDVTEAALKATREAQRELTTQEKIDAAKAPVKHSWFMRWMNNLAAKDSQDLSMWNKFLPNHPFIKEAEEAQNTLGIAKEDQIPVVVCKFDDDKRHGGTTGAFCKPKWIVGNVNMILAPSFEKVYALHEAAHHKNLDPAHRVIANKGLNGIFTLFPWAIWATFGIWATFNAMKIGNKINKKKIGIFPFFLWMAASPAILYSMPKINDMHLEQPILDKYSEFQEQRADTTAAYATECHQCVEAFTGGTVAQPSGGYLNRNELYKIADELRAANKNCRYHQMSSQERIQAAEEKDSEHQNKIPISRLNALNGLALNNEFWTKLKNQEEVEFIFAYLQRTHVYQEENWLNTPRENRNTQ